MSLLLRRGEVSASPMALKARSSPLAVPDPMMATPLSGHYRLHIGEIHIDITMNRNDFGNAFGSRSQDIIGLGKSMGNFQVSVNLP